MPWTPSPPCWSGSGGGEYGSMGVWGSGRKSQSQKSDFNLRTMRPSHTPAPPHSQTQQALIVFAKAPEAGRVKTRLTKVLAPEEAARLYAAFVRDALRQYAGLGGSQGFGPHVRLYAAPPVEAFPEALVPAGVTLHEQAGRGLGARMMNAFRETFGAGYARAVVIGTDHPTLPSAYVRRAFEALHVPPAVSLGPSTDGGYYLLGLTEPRPALFEGMTYSHAGVFEQTAARAEATPARLTVLPTWYDVDTPADLRRLRAELARSGPEAPATRAALARLMRQDGRPRSLLPRRREADRRM